MKTVGYVLCRFQT